MPTREFRGVTRAHAFREARNLHSLKGHAVPEKAKVVDRVWEVTYHWSDERRKK